MTIYGHEDVAAQFRTALAKGRLASTFLFVGPAGIGKRAFAERLAQVLLCQQNAPAEMQPCGECPGCRGVLAGTHPDLITVAKPPERSSLPIELLIGAGERRMREGLCHDIGLKPFMGGRKVGIIDDADSLNVEGANCLLKTLEEPPPNSVLILIGTSLDRQLPTIRSRSQIIRFRPLPDAIVARLLLEQQVVETQEEAERLAAYAEGSPGRARELADEELWTFRKRLLRFLAQPLLGTAEFREALGSFVDDAGKEAALRRNRLRLVFCFAAEFFRQVVRASAGMAQTGDADLDQAVERAVSQWDRPEELAARGIERTLEALYHVDRNVHQQAVISSWLDELAAVAVPLP